MQFLTRKETDKWMGKPTPKPPAQRVAPPKKKKRRRKKGRRNGPPGMKASVREAAGELDRLNDLANDHGLAVEVYEVSCKGGRVKTLHLQFFHKDGSRVLEYWPGTGRFWSPLTGEKGTVPDVYQALDEAARIHSEICYQRL